AAVREKAGFVAGLGAHFICSAAGGDDGWSPRIELDDRQWEHLLRALAQVDEVAAESGVQHVLHPHWRTLVERDDDVRRVLDGSSVRICLDTGHLVLGGSNPLEIATSFPDRIAHVHLKDVREAAAVPLPSGDP